MKDRSGLPDPYEGMTREEYEANVEERIANGLYWHCVEVKQAMREVADRYPKTYAKVGRKLLKAGVLSQPNRSRASVAREMLAIVQAMPSHVKPYRWFGSDARWDEIDWAEHWELGLQTDTSFNSLRGDKMTEEELAMGVQLIVAARVARDVQDWEQLHKLTARLYALEKGDKLLETVPVVTGDA